MPRIRPIFAWYDLWIGAYWDRQKRRLYLMVFMVGLVLDWGAKEAPSPKPTPPPGLQQVEHQLDVSRRTVKTMLSYLTPEQWADVRIDIGRDTGQDIGPCPWHPDEVLTEDDDG